MVVAWRQYCEWHYATAVASRRRTALLPRARLDPAHRQLLLPSFAMLNTVLHIALYSYTQALFLDHYVCMFEKKKKKNVS